MFIGRFGVMLSMLVVAGSLAARKKRPISDSSFPVEGPTFGLLLLGIIIRPPLMVAGFFAAVILMNVIGRLIGVSFEMLVAGTSQAKVLGITGTISMLVILGIVVIMTANKLFSLIHYLPEHVTNWIGQQFHSLGEKEDQSGVKGVFVGSTSAVSSGADGASKLRHSLRQTGAQGDDLSEHNFRS